MVLDEHNISAKFKEGTTIPSPVIAHFMMKD